MTLRRARTMLDLNEIELLLRIQMKGVVDAETAKSLAHELDVPEPSMRGLVTDGTLADDEGFMYVTDHGNRLLTNELAGHVTVAEVPQIEAFADVFDVLDSEVKAALTAWQQAASAQNDEAQMAAVERWLEADSQLRVAAAGSGAVFRLFGRCLTGLEQARESVLDGDVELLSGHADSSYHSVWFLLHETLLRSLRRERSRG